MSIITILAIIGLFIGILLAVFGFAGNMSSTGGTTAESYVFMAGVVILCLSVGWLFYRIGHALWCWL